MDNKTFDALSEARQKAVARKKIAELFGKRYAKELHSHIGPLAENNIGHGKPHELNHSSDPDDPQNNFWGGAWEVYDTDKP